MTPAEWLRWQRATVRRGPDPRAVARFTDTLETIETVRRIAESPDAVAAAVERAEAVLAAAEAPAPAPQALRAVPLVIPVTITDSMVRCGCWPRYTGAHYCGARTTR